VAFLMGVEAHDIFNVADLLGIKLAANEFVAYTRLTTLAGPDATQIAGALGQVGGLGGTSGPLGALPALTGVRTEAGLIPGSRSYILATYALTGFANFSSIGIQLGGIGALAPNRRGDLARLGGRALLAGFTATLVNASLAGLLM
jgi:nucleoside permease NupC